jgi:hypothetical protein
LAALEDTDPDQVAGHQVGGELHARELQPERHRQRVGQGGLADAGHVFDQQVPAGQQAGHAVLDLQTFADDDRANLVDQPGQLARGVLLHAPDHSLKLRDTICR